MIKALSIRQPWAWLVVNGHKNVENRTWETFHRGPVLIHAGKEMTRADFEACELFIAADPLIRHLVKLLPMPQDLERGGIVGQARIIACQRRHESPWFTGAFAHVIANAKPLPFTPMKGMLNYFDVPGVWP